MYELHLDTHAVATDPRGREISFFSENLKAEVFADEQPERTLDVMFLEQLEACHSLMLKMFQNAGMADYEDTKVKYLRIAERLMRTFAGSFEAYEKARRGCNQSMVVKHVHVNAGGQAVVGNVGGGNGGPNEK
ncbi:hypothetical protein DPQ33_17500 [Oceanidesulfovibrio indonesiensis]|uniref:Uncharacterized protein n=1 Tax=Oceanidesulfovibrio indonesiensis TaxID=54767 RepID=A0A7M3MA85_9BACT|nr:hypothetical protein [Oceanidesulfovibrio indonesiensis]TVM14510.1 hypothetical protein DPQ33_17500 [Oceanidesulfovibrio indonesiensis]